MHTALFTHKLTINFFPEFTVFADQIKNSLPEGSLSSDPMNSYEAADTVYKCRKCRSVTYSDLSLHKVNL